MSNHSKCIKIKLESVCVHSGVYVKAYHDIQSEIINTFTLFSSYIPYAKGNPVGRSEGKA